METEDGVIWIRGLGEDGVMALTDFGIENLIELIKIYKEDLTYPSGVARRRRSRLQRDRLARIAGSSLWILIRSIRFSMPKSVKAISPSSEES